MENKWKLEEYTIMDLQNDINSNRISIPKYQRGIVWDKGKQFALIETIKKGYPFGSILVYEDDRGKLQLIDGLQRCTTIFKFISNPSCFFNEQDVDNNVIYQIIDLLGLSNANNSAVRECLLEEIKTMLIKWVASEHSSMEEVTQMQFIDFAALLAKQYPSLNDAVKMFQISNLIGPMLKDYISVCKFISTVKIPVIKLSGNQENLPEVFERINSTGAKLTKYQIFNATWSNVTVQILNTQLDDIVNHVCNRYDEMVEGTYEIEDYDSTEMKKNKRLNIFDLCFGFGKLLCDKYPFLFGNAISKTSIESVGFSLINACMAHKVSDIDKLHTNIRNLGDDRHINDFLCKIIESVDEVNKQLSFVTTFKGNRRSNNKNIVVNHTELQIISIIASLFIQKYVTIVKDDHTDAVISRRIDLSGVSPAWKKNKKDFKQNCVIIYIMDCLNKKWRGSGDRKLNSILVNNSYYSRTVPWDELERTLDMWFDTVLEERNEEQRVANPDECDRILLNVIYAQTFNAIDHLGERNFDIEHLATKGALRDYLNKINSGKPDSERLKLPISSFGNLCYLPEVSNRSKGKKTIYQDVAYLNTQSIQDIEEKYTFTVHADMEWLEEDSYDRDTLKAKYFGFVRNRWGKQKQKVKSCLYPANP